MTFRIVQSLVSAFHLTSSFTCICILGALYFHCKINDHSSYKLLIRGRLLILVTKQFLNLHLHWMDMEAETVELDLEVYIETA